MSEPSDSFFGLHFTKRQNRIVTASVTWVLLLVGVVALGRFLGAVRDFIGHHSNVLLPPVIGIILAMIVKPVYNVVERLFRGRRLPAVAVTTIIVFIPVVAFLWFCGDLLVSQGLRFLDAAPDLYRQAAGYIARKTPAATALIDRFGLAFLLNGDRLEELMKTYLPKVLAPAGDTAVSIGSYLVGKTVALLGWIVLPVYTAFFLATRPLGGKDVEKLLVFTTPRTRGNVAYLVDQFLDIVVAFFRGQVIIVVIQGILYGIGFQLAGLPYGFFIGFVLGLLNIVPYLGNILGLGVTLPLAWFGPGGSLARLCWVLGIFVAVHTLDTYFITPRVMRSKTGLSSFVVIFSIFFWGSVIGGILGMLLAIPLSAFVVVFWRLLVKDYIHPLMRDPKP